ncbi:hypothetical protein ES702_01368 [subsurface metagenome]
MFLELGKTPTIDTLYKKNDHPAYPSKRPGSLISRVERLKTVFIIRQMSQNVKDPINSIIKFTVGKEYL